MGPFSAGYERVIISSEALRLTADLAQNGIDRIVLSC